VAGAAGDLFDGRTALTPASGIEYNHCYQTR
jgi:hypothetical protein